MVITTRTFLAAPTICKWTEEDIDKKISEERQKVYEEWQAHDDRMTSIQERAEKSEWITIKS